MSSDSNTGKFPSCFPKDFVTEILPQDASFENRVVYRIIKNGIINRDSFLSSFEEDAKNNIVRKIALDLMNPSTYSTSCFDNKSKARKMLKFFMKRNPAAFLAKGITAIECGPSQVTFCRTNDKNDKAHIDWWIYDDSKPHVFFEKAED